MFGIGSFISGVCSCVCSVVSAAVSAVSSFASGAMKVLGKIGGMIGGLATKLCAFVDAACIAVLGPVLGPIVAMLIKQAIADAIASLAEAIFGINDKPEEVGYRIEEAAKHPEWLKPEDPRFKSFEDYYLYLKEMIPDDKIDREKLAKHSLEYAMVGMAAEAVAISKKQDIELGNDFLEIIGLGKLSPAEVNAIMDAFKGLGFDRVALKEYLNGSMLKEERVRVGAALRNALKTVIPEEAINQRLNDLREISSSDINVATKKSYDLFHKLEADDIVRNEIRSDYFKVIPKEAVKMSQE